MCNHGFRNFVVPVVAVFTFCSVAWGQCDDLMKFGIYDSYGVLATQTDYRLAQTYICSNESDLKNSNSSVSSNAALLIEDIPVQMGVNKSDSNSDDWKKTFCSWTYDEAFHHQLVLRTVKQISPALMAVVKECLDQQKTGFVSWIATTNDRTRVTFSARFRPIANETTTVTAFDILPKSVSTSCQKTASYALFQKGHEIGNALVTMTCEIKPETAVTFTMNTKGGGNTVTLEGKRDSPKTPQYRFTVDAAAHSIAAQWLDTGLSATLGMSLEFVASGHACLGHNIGCSGPEGSEERFGACPINGKIKCGALYGKIGNGEPFFIGNELLKIVRDEQGVLYLGYADINSFDNMGSYTVFVTITGPTPSKPSTPAKKAMAKTQ